MVTLLYAVGMERINLKYIHLNLSWKENAVIPQTSVCIRGRSAAQRAASWGQKDTAIGESLPEYGCEQEQINHNALTAV